MPPRGADAAAAAVDDGGRGDEAAEEEEPEPAPQRRAVPSKQRPRRSAGDPGVCQVAECGAGLEGQPPYNRRYRICDSHYRAACTVVDGVPSRFCQQCGRFHELQAFDADCRSCRKELELHNKRRRRRAAALAAAGLQPSRGRKSRASGGARAAAAPRSRAAAGSDAAHAAAPAHHAAAMYGGMPRGATDFASANIMEQVLGWSALSRGGGGVGGGQMGGDGAAAHAAAANAGVAAALAAFAARHVGTGASIYGGGGGGGPPGLAASMPHQGLYRAQDGLDNGTAALLAAGWPHGTAGGMAGLPSAGAGGLMLGDMLSGYPGLQGPPHYGAGGLPPPHQDGGAGPWGAGGA